tara:strand:+ start:615 stop:1598 length:984 start_codon:yes stop_codon:yes gene_type:complete
LADGGVTAHQNQNPDGKNMLVIWRLCDSKPGHDRQSLGLVRALAEMTPVELVTLDVHDQRISPFHFLARQLPFAKDAPAPDLIIGAGSACQWPMLNVKRSRGGKTIYLMKPHIPLCFFDLCLIPRHDQATATPRSIVTDGVLNDIEPTSSQGNQGFILIGGPSDHYSWDQEHLIVQIRAILEADGAKLWVISDSRRTPAATREALQSLAGDNITFLGYQESTSNNVAAQLARSDVVWVSSDSVSMIFEAITSGAAVGAIEMPARRIDRITTIVADLSRRKQITKYADWRRGAELQAPARLAEADRCAAIILERWDPISRQLHASSAP